MATRSRRAPRRECFPLRVTNWELLVLRHRAEQDDVSPAEKVREIIKAWDDELSDFERRTLLAKLTEIKHSQTA